MNRRDLLGSAFAAAALTPFGSRAQPKAMPVVGFLHSASPGAAAPFVAAFRQGLSEMGYVEGKNLAVKYRWVENRYDRLPALAAELVDSKVDAIAATGG